MRCLASLIPAFAASMFADVLAEQLDGASIKIIYMTEDGLDGESSASAVRADEADDASGQVRVRSTFWGTDRHGA